MSERSSGSRRSAWVALLLLVPIPTLGTTVAMVVAPGPVGNTAFALCKIWILTLPALWWLWVERGRPSWSPPVQGGLVAGAGLGLILATVIVAAFWLIGVSRIDPELLRTATEGMGLATPLAYLGGALYWIFVNSVLEEYVFRWFVFRQCERLMPGPAAVTAAAAVFTAHHIIALNAYLDPLLTTLASVGIFIGGATWSWCYLRYRSIWPGWISHAIVDVAVFGIGWWIIFGTWRCPTRI